MTETNNHSLPVHVGIILDGNRRWAQSKGLPTLEGHRQGAEVFKQVALHAFDIGIKFVSAYVFSNENKRRSEEEIGYLMKLVIKAVENYLDEFKEKGIKIVILGQRDELSGKVLEAVTRAEDNTKNNTKGTLALCFNYGGHEEIADAAEKLSKNGMEITPEAISNSLYSPEIPPLDLIIRTSGEQRLSGFMLWRSAYAELYFSPAMWPAFTVNDFDSCLSEYEKRNRRFGE